MHKQLFLRARQNDPTNIDSKTWEKDGKNLKKPVSWKF
jgi:hypothetical protein